MLKRMKYQHLVSDIKSQGWTVHIFPFELGCRGFATNSLYKFLSRLGSNSHLRKCPKSRTAEAASRGSAWVWSKYLAAARVTWDPSDLCCTNSGRGELPQGTEYRVSSPHSLAPPPTVLDSILYSVWKAAKCCKSHKSCKRRKSRNFAAFAAFVTFSDICCFCSFSGLKFLLKSHKLFTGGFYVNLRLFIKKTGYWPCMCFLWCCMVY